MGTLISFVTYSFGTTTTCVPFLNQTYAMVAAAEDGNYTAHLYCNSSACDNCLVQEQSISGCQPIRAFSNWILLPIPSLSACFQVVPTLQPTPPKSGLSAGAIAGIAAGGAVGVIGIVASATYFWKRRQSYSPI